MRAQAEALSLQTTKVKALQAEKGQADGTGQERLESELAQEASALSSMQARQLLLISRSLAGHNIVGVC